MKTQLPLSLLALTNLPLCAAPSVQLPEEWLTPLESQPGYALTDTETGQVRIMTFTGGNALQQVGPTETYLPNVTGLTSGYFEGGPEHLILSSADHNQIRLLPVDGSASPSSRSTDLAGPAATIPLFTPGDTPLTLSHCLYVDGGEGLHLMKAPLSDTTPSTTDQSVYPSGVTSLQPFRVPGTGERRGLLLNKAFPIARLEEISFGVAGLTAATKLPVGDDLRLATEVVGNDGRLCTICYQPGDNKCGIFTHGFSGFAEGLAAAPSLGFPLGTMITVGSSSIPNATDGVLITSQDGTVAVWARVIAGASLSVQETFFASAGTAYAGLVPVPGRGFATLLGTPGDRSAADWALYRDTGSGFNQVATGNLSPWIDTNNRFATLFWFDGAPLVQPSSQLLRVETVPDWTTGTGALPQSISTEMRDLNPNDGDGDQGLNNPTATSPAAPPAATHVMSNQYQANASVSALDDSVTLSSLPLSVSPASGTYSESVLVNVLADDSTIDIYYREQTSGASWQVYESPLTIGYPSTWQFYAYDRANRSNGPIVTRNYDFSSDLNLLDTDQDGVPDYVERHYGLDPAGGADSDGDFQSDLEEILGKDGIGTDPNDSGDYLAEADRDPPFLGEGFYLYAQAFNAAGTEATAFDDGGTPVTDPSDANQTAIEREDDTAGEKIRAFNMVADLVATGEVAEITSGGLTGFDGARLDITNPLPESEWVILSSPINFNVGPTGAARTGRETLRVAPRPSFELPSIAAFAGGTDRANDVFGWVSAARVAYSTYSPLVGLTRLDPIDNAISALCEQALYEALTLLTPAERAPLGIPSDAANFSLFGGRDYDTGKVAFSDDMKRALVSNGQDFPAILSYLDTQARASSNIESLAEQIYLRHVAISDSTPNMALPLDALRFVIRDGAITDPGEVVALTYDPVDGTVATSTTRPNPYGTIPGTLITNARNEMLTLLTNVPSLKREVSDWNITIESATTPLHDYDYRRQAGGNLAYFVDEFGDRVPLEQGLGLNLGAVFNVSGYTDVTPVGGFDTMEILTINSVMTPVASDSDSNANLLDDDWEKFFFGALGVVGPFDPHPISGNSYLEYHLSGADPREGEITTTPLVLTPTDVCIVWLPSESAYQIQFSFPDQYVSAMNFSLLSSTNLNSFGGPVEESFQSLLPPNRHALQVTGTGSNLDKNFFQVQMSLAD